MSAIRKLDEPWKWNEWVRARGRFVGFRRDTDLAAEVGCRPERLCVWLSKPTPPERMLKGFDRALAVALRVERKTLFSDYVHIDPREAETHDSTDALRREVKAAAETLGAADLAALHEAISRLHGGARQSA